MVTNKSKDLITHYVWTLTTWMVLVRPQRVVCLNALAFLKGCWELFDLIPLSKVLGVKGKAHISALYIIKGLLTPKVTNLSFFFTLMPSKSNKITAFGFRKMSSSSNSSSVYFLSTETADQKQYKTQQRINNRQMSEGESIMTILNFFFKI